MRCNKVYPSDQSPRLLAALICPLLPIITGEDCFIVRLVVQEMNELETAIDALAKFGPVTTSIVLASYPPKAIVGA